MSGAPLRWLSMLRLLAALLAGGGIGTAVAHATGAAPRALASTLDPSAPGISNAAPALPGAIWDRAPGLLGASLRAPRTQWDGGTRTTPPLAGGAARPGGTAALASPPARATRRATLVLADLRTRHAATPRLGAAHHYPTAPPSGR